MASRGGGGRDRFRRDCPPRLEDKSHQGRPPSRHLWVGNLSHCIDENVLSQHFLRFGELDSIACQPGRSYAFINFKREEDAVSAMRELHGFPVAGMPFKIEFAKAASDPAPSKKSQPNVVPLICCFSVKSTVTRPVIVLGPCLDLSPSQPLFGSNQGSLPF